MTRRGIIVASLVGLALSIAEAVLMPSTLSRVVNTQAISLAVAAFGTVAAGIAGRVILGTRPVHRYFRAGVPVLAAAAGLAFESAASNWLIAEDVLYGPPPDTLRPAVIYALIIGSVVYLIAATVYGFAGTSQGVRVEVRVRLLLLLLLAVVPFINLLGFVGLVLVAFLWKPTETTPAPPEASV